MEISKSAVLPENEHQSDQKNVTNDFHIDFRYVKSNGMPEIQHQGGF